MVALSKTDVVKSQTNKKQHSLRKSKSSSSSSSTTSLCRILLLTSAVLFLVLFGLVNFITKISNTGSTSSSSNSNKSTIWIESLLSTIGLISSSSSSSSSASSSIGKDIQQQQQQGQQQQEPQKITKKKSSSDSNELETPEQPLCEECLQIVTQAEKIDITYVDIRKKYEQILAEDGQTMVYPHPHMGATIITSKEDGIITYNYVADETSLYNNPPKFNFLNLPVACSHRDDHYTMIHNKIRVQQNHISTIKLFCLVYTTSTSHNQLHNIRETWGSKCDGFIIGSNLTDTTLNTVNIIHAGEEAYGNIWQKVRSMWSYVYDNYYNKYDWFHIGGDDLFLLVENLKYYLDSDEIRTASNGGYFLPNVNENNIIQTPLFLGRRFAYMGDMNEIFNSGGSGYTINKAALKTLVTLAMEQYGQKVHTFSEDTMVARLLKHYGIVPYETKDIYGSERYMPFAPGHHYSYRIPKPPNDDWYAKYSINIKEGLDHCSTYSIAFHYIKGDFMKRLYAMLYNLCPPGSLE